MNNDLARPVADDSELSALIETLHQTNRRLEELTAGEVDTVADREGRTFLLRHAQERLRTNDAAKQAAILDALPANIALLDTVGRIVSVNRSWERFAIANAMIGAPHSRGTNYLDICDAATGDCATEAPHAALGIRSVMSGVADNFTLDYPCHSPTQQRWFRMMVTPLANQRSVGAVIMHIDISAERGLADEIASTQEQLIAASRQAGMADVATSVLHNVGNVLNSVNVSADLAMEMISTSRVSRIADVVSLLREHASDLAGFISGDARGRHIPMYLEDISREWALQQQSLIEELSSLRGNIDHIKQIVAMQQSHAAAQPAPEWVAIPDLIEDALRTQRGWMYESGVSVDCDLDHVPPISVVKHNVLQILINLLRNATLACVAAATVDKRVRIRARQSGDRVLLIVTDNGVGIPPENMTRIFSHGFTTRKDGHGFGLHSGALAAAELKGSLTAQSDGPGTGAAFTLDLPCAPTAIAP